MIYDRSKYHEPCRKAMTKPARNKRHSSKVRPWRLCSKMPVISIAVHIIEEITVQHILADPIDSAASAWNGHGVYGADNLHFIHAHFSQFQAGSCSLDFVSLGGP